MAEKRVAKGLFPGKTQGVELSKLLTRERLHQSGLSKRGHAPGDQDLDMLLEVVRSPAYKKRPKRAGVDPLTVKKLVGG